MLKVNDKIKVHLYSIGTRKEIETRNYDKVFTVYKKNGRLGIDWNIEKSPYTSKGDVFTPFYAFANTVIFEDMGTGRKYFYDNIVDDIREVS